MGQWGGLPTNLANGHHADSPVHISRNQYQLFLSGLHLFLKKWLGHVSECPKVGQCKSTSSEELHLGDPAENWNTSIRVGVLMVGMLTHSWTCKQTLIHIHHHTADQEGYFWMRKHL